MSEFTDNRQKSLEHLVEAGADPGVQDNWGRTVLHRLVLVKDFFGEAVWPVAKEVGNMLLGKYATSEGEQMVYGLFAGTIISAAIFVPVAIVSNNHMEAYDNSLQRLDLYEDSAIEQPVATHQQQRYHAGKNAHLDTDLPHVDLRNIQDNDGMTAAHLLAARGAVDELRVLLRVGSGLDVNIPNFAGDTALFTAVKESRGVGVVDLLLKYGAHPNLPDANGVMALHIAIANASPDVAAKLISHGANVNIPDSHGNFPIHLAVMANDPITAKLLVDHGADINAVNSDGKRPVDLIPSQGIKRDGSDKDYSKRAWANLFAEAHVSKYTEERQRTNADHSFENIQAYASTSGLIGGDISIYDMFVEKLDEANEISVNEARDQMLAASRVKQGIAYQGKSADDRNGDSQHSRA